MGDDRLMYVHLSSSYVDFRLFEWYNLTYKI